MNNPEYDYFLYNYSYECYPWMPCITLFFRKFEWDKGDNKFSTEIRRTSFRSMTKSSFARGSETTAVSSLSSKISLRFFESLCSINEENWTNDFFSLPFCKLRRFLKHLWYHFFKRRNTRAWEIQFLRNLRNYANVFRIWVAFQKFCRNA